MAAKPASIGDWISKHLKAEPPRSKSLIITIFGDSLAPHVPAVWLSELIELLQPFGVNERLVRTSAFRLTEQGWLQSQRDGRVSRYSLTSSGAQRFAHAYRRVYATPATHWNGEWTLVVLSKNGNGAAERLELRRELEWEGFGSLGSGIFLQPRADADSLREILERLNMTGRAVVLRVRDLDGISARPVKALAEECWNLDEVIAQYQHFLTRFETALPLVSSGKSIMPQAAFVLQTLLIHSFRRVSLRDPHLPAAILPKTWPGHAAYNLCRELYRMTFREVRNHLASTLHKGARTALAPSADFVKRFGGLGR